MILNPIESKLNEFILANKMVHNELDCKRSKMKMLADKVKDLETLQVAVQQAAQYTQNKLQARFTDIVQSCLDVVFPGAYKFKLEFVCKRGKTEVEVYLDDNGNKLDPLTANGGGVVDVISFALRVAALTLSDSQKILLLDEPFPRLRGEARNKLGDIVEGMSHKLGIQIIMVGDVAGTGIMADKVFKVTKENGVSKVTEIENEASKVQ